MATLKNKHPKQRKDTEAAKPTRVRSAYSSAFLGTWEELARMSESARQSLNTMMQERAK